MRPALPLLVLLFALVFLDAGCAAVRPADPRASEAEVLGVLNAQVEAWNRGDLEAFMDGYVRTDALRFVSNGQARTGWQGTLDRYRRAYPDRAAMGRLAFEELDVRLLAPGWAAVYGRFRLRRAQDEPTGLFTLLLEKRPEGWRVVQDHTSVPCE